MEDVHILNNMTDLSQMDDPQNSSLAWIGLFDAVDTWRWATAGGEENLTFTNWRLGQPDNWRIIVPASDFGQEDCGVIYIDKYWLDTSCQSRNTFICSHVQGGSVSYVPVDIWLNWTEAQSYCREHYTDLPIITNQSENTRVHQARNHHLQDWIGLFRDAWKWEDGSNSTFRNWKFGYPKNFTGDCAVTWIADGGKWQNRKCDTKLPFICYSDPVKTFLKLRLEKNSSLDLNDPVVLERVLMQIKQKLKDKGIKEDMKLSWTAQPNGKVFHKEKEKKDEL
ncbi:asialoglycoprotein receptor 2-like [Menidia menidia]